MSLLKLSARAALIAALSAGAAAAREQIRVVGSSTVFPYSQAAAEEFANLTGYPAPVVEATGTGGGMKIFCGGVGERFPDVTGASRAMKRSEYELCRENGVSDITEAMIGYDGLTIAVSRENEYDWDLTEEQIYLALAAQVPVDGEWADNPYRRWSEIDPSLPDVEILAYGPPPTSGTRDAFVELTMFDGCEALDFVQQKKAAMEKTEFKDWRKQNCSRMRQDGPFVEAGENDNLIVQRLEADPNALGIFGYSFLYENADRLKAVRVNGIEPTPETIADFSYDIARPLYIYIKNAHRGVIPGLEEFLAEYVSEESLGDGGYQQERGLTVLAPELLEAVQNDVLNAVPMKAPE